MKLKFIAVWLCIASSGCASFLDRGGRDESIAITYNTEFIEHIQKDNIDLENRNEVLKLVLSRAGDIIRVYPSEGYFYFTFYSEGDLVKGNLRFDKFLREDGLVSFAYFRQSAGRGRGNLDRNKHWTLGPDDGLFLTQIEDFKFELRFEEISSTVEIYEAHEELAAPKPVNKGELYVGPVFDESGVRFHLIFDERSHVFLFVLNEMFPPVETYRPLKNSSNILIGSRTQFALYNDPLRNRKTLIGVSRNNVIMNTPYDGPFDQLPDSFMDPDEFKELLLLYKPSLKGKIGPAGIFLSKKDVRVGLYPYLEYASEKQLLRASKCQSHTSSQSKLNSCLANLARMDPRP